MYDRNCRREGRNHWGDKYFGMTSRILDGTRFESVAQCVRETCLLWQEGPDVELSEAFAVLEIVDGSSFEEAKTAYQRLCIVWHPDRFQNPELKAHAEEKLKRIKQAFATIKSSTTAGKSAVDTDPGDLDNLFAEFVCSTK